MSYQLELGEVPADEIGARLRERAQAVTAGWDNDERALVNDHVVNAATAIEYMLAGMGDPSRVRVAVVGHTNPDHRSHEGYAYESMTISVGVAPEQSEQELAENESSDTAEPTPAAQ